MYRYRLIDAETGEEMGPFVSARLTFAPGETVVWREGVRLEVVKLVPPENENFRAYLVVREAVR